MTHACVLSHFSHVWLFVMLWTVARQAPLSLGFSRQEYWSGLSFPSPGDLPDLGIKLTSLISPAWTGRFFTTGATWEAWHDTWDSIKDCIWELGRFCSLLKIYLFIYLFLSVLGLCCCKWAFSGCGTQGLLSSCGAQASHYSGFSCCRAAALEHRLSSCGTGV